MNKDISIEHRKSQLAKEILHLGLLNAKCRVEYLCDLPDLEIKLQPLLEEFKYLIKLQEGS